MAMSTEHGDLLDVMRRSFTHFRDVVEEGRRFLILLRAEPRGQSEARVRACPVGSLEAARRLFAV
ncbi:hypothetical protein ACNJYD_09240 [Bradyrhizobium sp. DASA03005]|uniref:hypothetical protein n=1 Tax=Bradyrhizobium sp. SPXBL-02 TaxID=3395912 RepID=UPI003F701204